MLPQHKNIFNCPIFRWRRWPEGGNSYLFLNVQRLFYSLWNQGQSFKKFIFFFKKILIPIFVLTSRTDSGYPDTISVNLKSWSHTVWNKWNYIFKEVLHFEVFKYYPYLVMLFSKYFAPFSWFTLFNTSIPAKLQNNLILLSKDSGWLSFPQNPP